MRIIWRVCYNADFYSGGLQYSQKSYISNKFPGNAYPADAETFLGKPLSKTNDPG